MKEYGILGLILILILMLVLTISGCGGGSSSSSNPGGGTSYTGVAFTMIDVPAQSYEIAQTEVTYELWYAVKTWALNNGYSFANAGREGNDGTAGAAPTSSSQEPVTTVSWRDAMIWCNALTEYYAAKGGTGYKCVYCSDSAYTTPIRTSTASSIDMTDGKQDAPYINPDAKGFRLPTGEEWYQAARYIDGTKYYLDNYASGADAAYAVTASADYDDDGDTQSTGDVAVYFVNSGSATAVVKSKSPNKLGVYDMSGNVWELCFDISSGSSRKIRGGSWNSGAGGVSLDISDGTYPYDANYYLGFRVVRTN
jgi:formylglycine-generating enzyme